MPSVLNGKKKLLLEAIWLMNKAGHGFSTDIRHRPPADIMKPLLKCGYVYLTRVGTLKKKVTNWWLTDKGKKAINVNDGYGGPR